MTYFGFLLRFIVLPILMLALLNWWDARVGRQLPQSLRAASPWAVLGVLILVALIYTTPWDNYLVASGVWWYDPALVSGAVFGWVPLEEYLFFLLQPILVGLWLVWLARRIPVSAAPAPGWTRIALTAGLGVAWIVSVVLLATNSQSARYLALTLSWALPPLLLQLGFGADVLLRHWRLLIVTIVTATLYLAGTDAIAISAGTWTIDPAQSTGFMLGGVLPLEEFIFFLLITLLISWGLTLGIAEESWDRLRSLRKTQKAY